MNKYRKNISLIYQVITSSIEEQILLYIAVIVFGGYLILKFEGIL